ncbi:MAG: DUF2752 domain-containing protein [Saprospiraceae bacterium]
MKTAKLFDYAYLVFLILTPVIVLILPADYFDYGPTICPSKRFFDIECFGCGMTRAVMHLVHLDFDSAIYFNKASLLLAPVLGAFWVFWIKNAIIKVLEKPTPAPTDLH